MNTTRMPIAQTAQRRSLRRSASLGGASRFIGGSLWDTSGRYREATMGTTTLRADDLAARLGGALRHCPPDRPISEVRPLEEAGEGAVSFLANLKYAAKARESAAGLILVDPKADLGERPCCVVENPYWAFAQ